MEYLFAEEKDSNKKKEKPAVDPRTSQLLYTDEVDPELAKIKKEKLNG